MSDLGTLARDLAGQFISGFSADQGIAKAATYRRMPRNPAPGASRLDFSSLPISTHAVVGIDESPTFAFTRGASGDPRQSEQEYDLTRLMDAEQFSVLGFEPATGDQWEEGGRIYRIDKIQDGDPVKATIRLSLTFLRAA